MEKAKDCIRCIDIGNSRRHNDYDCLSIMTLLTLYIRNYIILLIALRTLILVISDLKL